MQYAVDTTFEFFLNSHQTKESMIKAASNIEQKQGLETNTFKAIDFARYAWFFLSNVVEIPALIWHKIPVGVSSLETYPLIHEFVCLYNLSISGKQIWLEICNGGLRDYSTRAPIAPYRQKNK